MLCCYSIRFSDSDWPLPPACLWGVGEGLRVLTKVLCGRFRPEVQPLSLTHTTFVRKGTPSLTLILAICKPFTFLV